MASMSVIAHNHVELCVLELFCHQLKLMHLSFTLLGAKNAKAFRAAQCVEQCFKQQGDQAIHPMSTTY